MLRAGYTGDKYIYIYYVFYTHMYVSVRYVRDLPVTLADYSLEELLLHKSVFGI